MSRLVAGCMTGTSIDSIDAALVRIEGKGLGMHAQLVRGATRPLGELAPRLRRLADQEPMTPGEIAALSREFSLAHVPVLRELMGKDRADLIAVHGQTVYHKPPVSWQMLTPAVIAREMGVPVVFDLRAADLAAGGQGAPITPIADWVFFGLLPGATAIVNLGGFCNVTVLPGAGIPPSEIRGFDVCPCNHLLDTIARKLFFVPYDEDGKRAAAGRWQEDSLVDLEGVLASLAGGKRSLGTGDEALEWVSRWRAHVEPSDLAATACEAIGHSVAGRVKPAERVFLAGGGTKNAALVSAIRANTAARVSVPPSGVADCREAAAMGVLGALCQDRVPITLPRVTGVREPAPVAGVWCYP